MKAIRVLHVIHSLSGGGAEQQLCQLISHQKPGVDHWVACVKPEPQAVDLNPAQVLPLGRSAKDPRLFGAMLFLMKQLQPDVVHAWLPASVAMPAMLAGRLLGCKVVFSYRNQMSFHRILSFPEYLITALCASAVLSNNSSNHRDNRFFAWLFQRKHGRVVHNCVVTKTERRWSRSEDCGPMPLRLLFAGRLVRQKNLETLLTALALLDANVAVELSVLGEGDLRGELEDQVNALQLTEKVVFKDFCSNVVGEMLDSHLLVFPSWYEGMPNVLVEAMAIGLPCLLSDIPAHRELLEGYDSRAWFDPANVTALVNRIAAVIEDPAILADLSASGRNIARLFGVDEMVNHYATFYREL